MCHRGRSICFYFRTLPLNPPLNPPRTTREGCLHTCEVFQMISIPSNPHTNPIPYIPIANANANASYLRICLAWWPHKCETVSPQQLASPERISLRFAGGSGRPDRRPAVLHTTRNLRVFH